MRLINENPAIKLHLYVSANKPKYYERFKMNVNAFFTPRVLYFHKLSLKIQDLVKIEKTFLMKIKNKRFNEDFLIED